MTLRRWITVSGAVLAMAMAITSCVPPDPAADTASDTTTGVDFGSAAATLETLAVKGRAPKTGYEREQFGPAWSDTDHNGCDTRNDILARDLEQETFRPGTHDCIVLSGVLADPFTATEIHFLRGQDTSTAVQIDHVVALSDAWQKGAQQLDKETRTLFANDPLNLLAVDGPSNSQKGDGDAATWLPPNNAFRCDYVARQIAVKARYHLWVTSAEKDAMARELSTCSGHPLPSEQSAATSDAADTTATPAPVVEDPAPQPEVLPQSIVDPQSGTDPQFSNCTMAKDAGYGPYIAGIDAEYDWYRDSDNDGISCE
ncbi:GmrSD restriction endonuclease domain-containing protein [Corynebacterium sp. A21]|uniref:GmrSD restriction endonuclease domain-containing protein n=1 Tax=Corynebacterium sp. A21 TaxID=3457318 RepID=UPI003FD49622